MVETRSQTRNIAIKKEEVEDCKPALALGSARNTRNKIAKPKPPTIKNRNLPAPDIKMEQDIDIKSVLKISKPQKGPRISQEQINRLIDAIVNDKMSITKAARKVNMCKETGSCYYNMYKNDPEKKIPAPREGRKPPTRFYTQEHIENLIRYINDDKMAVKEASAKANMSFFSGRYYYGKYLKDPNHNIPIRLHKHYTQDQKNDLIGYVVNDKMSITAASKKAKMDFHTGINYYHKYFNVQNPDIAQPSHILTNAHKQEKIKELISYIFNDKMSVIAASKKVNMCYVSAARHYRQYLKGNNTEPPASKSNKRFTQDKVNELIGYITDDKMSIMAASKKASMGYSTGNRYYHRYLKQNNIRPPSSSKYTQDQINQLIGYIVDDKMSITAASQKASMSYTTGSRYYHRYLKQNNIRPPFFKYTHNQINQLIGYIVDDEMSITAASKKAGMAYATGYKYYQQYRNNQKQ